MLHPRLDAAYRAVTTTTVRRASDEFGPRPPATDSTNWDAYALPAPRTVDVLAALIREALSVREGAR